MCVSQNSSSMMSTLFQAFVVKQPPGCFVRLRTHKLRLRKMRPWMGRRARARELERFLCLIEALSTCIDISLWRIVASFGIPELVCFPLLLCMRSLGVAPHQVAIQCTDSSATPLETTHGRALHGGQ